MTVTMNTNGRAGRKSLADQIDRLDRLVDGLAEGLDEAVAAAVKQAVAIAVEEAVRSVLREVLTNPDLLAKLRAAETGVTAQAGPSPRERAAQQVARGWAWLKARARAVGGFVAGRLGDCCGAVMASGRRLRRQAAGVWLCCRAVRRFKPQLMTAVLVGVAAGQLSYWAGPLAAGLVSGLAGFTTALAVQAGLALRRIVRAAGA